MHAIAVPLTRVRIMGLCLVTMFAFGAVAATTASASAPEFGRCIKQAGGWKDAGCTVPAVPGEERYEWYPGNGEPSIPHGKPGRKLEKPGATARIKETTLNTLETTSGAKTICSSWELVIEYRPPFRLRIFWAKDHCESSPGALKCESAGQPEGVIVSKELEGVLGVVKKGTTAIKNILGVDMFSPVDQGPKHEAPIAEYSCAGVPVVVRGSIIHRVLANKMLSKAAEKFVETTGKQKPEKFEGQEKDVLFTSLNGAPFEESGEAGTVILKNEEPIEASSIN